ncbi:hypothetical protein N7495_004156 [Penicillium taxi]|uniref:uncharacterized protein n=1 Tax=Penicillium taxi TaxID=168475 RepID=UPI0025456A08|nr:uncharacterized protein N7495_004156 [Penicillium taxi]KAJ5899412.1 hypothetical protein N7495_004156 [Penicillium taxi]
MFLPSVFTESNSAIDITMLNDTGSDSLSIYTDERMWFAATAPQYYQQEEVMNLFNFADGSC